MTRPVFRFAPSPNGPLHLGHAYSALLNAKRAREADGRLKLRLEDIDRQRCRPEHEAAILADLDWLGFHAEKPVLRQSDRFPAYRAALDLLNQLGLLYGAPASRAEIAERVRMREAEGASVPRDPDGAPFYPFTARDRNRPVAFGLDAAIRLDIEKATRMAEAMAGPLTWQERQSDGSIAIRSASPRQWGDVVLARRDTPTSYHLSVVVDDAFEGVTHVVRGADLLTATSLHRVLQVLLDLTPPVYEHHPLIMGADGRKLSKSQGATRLSAWREEGRTLDALHARLGLERA